MRYLLRINLDTLSYKYEGQSGIYAKLGGRALSAAILLNETDPACDPLSPDNKYVIAAGLLAGSPIPNSGRLSIGTKSPLTKTIKESNAGGSGATKMARLNLIAIILEGAASELLNIKIDKDTVTFLPAPDFAGKGNSDVYNMLRAVYGDRIAVISNGPAGEKMRLSACTMVSSPDFFPRAAGRGGTGAVLGSKNVKAIILDDTGARSFPAVNPTVLKEITKEYTKRLLADRATEGHKQLGTAQVADIVNTIGGLPTKNFSMGRWDKLEKIDAYALADLLKTRPNSHLTHRCMPGCVVQCSQILTDAEGRFITSGLEYETLALVGSNCLIDDLDIIGHINTICNEYGLDTMDVGAALAVAMENGVIPWGDARGALKLVRECLDDNGPGGMLSHGCAFTGKKLGAKRVPVVKGQALAAYDPRAIKGTGVTYATTPMGADHTAGNVMPGRAGSINGRMLNGEKINTEGYDVYAPAGHRLPSKFMQTILAGVDSFGMCMFGALITYGSEENSAMLANAYTAFSGEEVPDDYLLRIGGQTLIMERAFNAKAGFTAKDDRLPEFFTTETLASTNTVFDVAEEELDGVHNNNDPDMIL